MKLETDTYENLEDAELVLLIGNRDEVAFRLLYERHRNAVFRYCAVMVESIDDARDVYQDVWSGFFAACNSSTSIGHVRGYLIRASRNRCLNLLRSRRRKETLVPEHLPPYRMDMGKSDLSDFMRKALLNLSPHYREAILLFEIEGYKYREIAALLDTTEPVVRNRVHRARRALRELLRPIIHDLQEDGRG